MIVFYLDRNKGEVGFSNAGDLSDHLGDKIEHGAIVAGEDLDADIGITGGVGDLADRFVLRELRGDGLNLRGFDLNEHICANRQPDTLGVDVAAHGDDTVGDQPIDAVAHRAFRDFPADAFGDLRAAHPAIIKQKV